MIFLVNNKILSPITYVISLKCLCAYFKWLFCAIAKVFYASFQIVCIFPKVFKVFYIKIHSQVLASKSSTLSKLTWKCKVLIAKNGKNLIDHDLILLVANLAIANFFNQSFCW